MSTQVVVTPAAEAAERSAPASSRSTTIAGWSWSIVRSLMWLHLVALAVLRYRSLRTAWRALSGISDMTRRVGRGSPGKVAVVSGRVHWYANAPGWPSLAANRFFAGELDRHVVVLERAPALQSAVIAITRRCPLQCEHCIEWNALRTKETVTLDELRGMLARFRDLGACQILLSGGEPLQRYDDLVELLRGAAKDCEYWILTSGLGLTPERAKELRRAGLTGIWLSLDHWDKAAHDEFRGFRGSYDQCERAAASTQQAGLVLGLSLCPTRRFTTPENLFRYREKATELGASFLRILEPRPLGAYEDSDVALTPEQLELLERFHDQLNRDPTLTDAPTVVYPALSNRRLRCFGAGDRYLYVDADGDLRACPFCPDKAGSAVGATLDASLATLRQGGCGDCAVGGHQPSSGSGTSPRSNETSA